MWNTALLLLSCWTIYQVHSFNLTQGSCRKDYVECYNGLNWRTDSENSCIPMAHLCDHDYDCSDGSDETFCFYNYNNSFEGFNYRFVEGYCNINHVLCPSENYCLHLDYFCDGIQQCENLSEENYCPYDPVKGFQFRHYQGHCPDGYYTCHTGLARHFQTNMSRTNCIKKTYICDRIQHCNDNSDELFCPYIFPITQETTTTTTAVSRQPSILQELTTTINKYKHTMTSTPAQYETSTINNTHSVTSTIATPYLEEHANSFANKHKNVHSNRVSHFIELLFEKSKTNRNLLICVLIVTLANTSLIIYIAARCLYKRKQRNHQSEDDLKLLNVFANESM